MSETKSRNDSIDAIKAIAALSVVFIHYNHVEGNIGEIYTRIIFNITKFAVPFFFMVTGFFLIPIIEKNREKKYVRKILLMALCSSAFYFVFYLLDSEDWLKWLKEHYTAGTIFTWLTGQDDPAGFHLWYLYCLLWTFAITATIYKYSNIGTLYIITLILMLYHFLNIGMFRCYTESIPAMVIGMIIYRNRDRISRFSPKLIAMCATCMLMLITIESYYEISAGWLYEGHILALIAFILALCAPPLNSSRLSYIGLEFSALIYILHVFVNNIFLRLMDFDSILLQIVKPWMIFGGSLGLATICVYISRLKFNYGAYKN